MADPIGGLGAPGAESGSPSDAAMSLDDVAALLVQVEVTDRVRLAAVRDALVNILNTQPLPLAVQKLIARAGQRVEEILQQAAANPETALREAGRYLEDATDALEAAGCTAANAVAPPEQHAAPPAPSAPATTAQAAPDVVTACPTGTSEEPGAPDSQQESLPEDTDLSLLGEYINECTEYVEGAEGALLTLETNPEDTESVNVVFRAFHTIKGTSAFFGLVRVSEFAHRAESLLSRIRDREIRYGGKYADLALRSVDMMKALVQSVQDALGGQPLIAPDGYAKLMAALANPEAMAAGDDMALVPASARLGDILVSQGVADREDIESVAACQGEQPIGVAILKAEVASLPEVAKALRVQQRMSGTEPAVESWVRVRTDRLDRLIEMVGELVIAESMVAQDATVLDSSHHELLKKVSQAGKIVRELQDLSMTMRMIPLKATFQKMARLVRDLAHKSGKTVSFVTDGEDTEIDRNMVDILSDPLVHMIRNASDHGIESPGVREAAGKPRDGTVTLMAYHAGGNVVLEVRDDGRGLDRQKIAAKALEKGLIESDKGLSESEIFNLVFAPGFSTADQVTDVSGRGVGMDVVRRNVESLNGHIEIASTPGRGSTFTIRLPLTLAITDGMLVRVGQERYIIPTISIFMSFRPEPSQLSTVAGRGEMVLLRGELMPMYRLERLFGVPQAVRSPEKGLLVVIGEGVRRYALMVDEVLGQQQVVAKAVGSGIGKIKGVSGAAILGDGRVGLILDPAETAAVARGG